MKLTIEYAATAEQMTRIEALVAAEIATRPDLSGMIFEIDFGDFTCAEGRYENEPSVINLVAKAQRIIDGRN